jgi:protein SSD1
VSVLPELAHARLYWTTEDVLSFLAETADDPHFQLLKARFDTPPQDDGHKQAADESALFDDEDDVVAKSKQYAKSRSRGKVEYQGLRSTASGHRIQDVKELMPIPVIITADMTKSPPVLVVYACRSILISSIWLLY